MEQTLFERFDKRPKFYLALAVFTYLMINNSINATSVWMEHNRGDGPPGIALWEPFVWEYTSALSSFILLPFLFWWFARMPLKVTGVGRQIALHIGATIVFSALHVGFMVAFRKGIYAMQSGTYEFGPVLIEFFYEYRKDAWGYLFWLVLFQVYRFAYSRLKGEASLIDSETPEQPMQSPEHLLVKKLDREFLVKVDEIEWLEAAGNYVNLHAGGRIYPLRTSLTALIPKLEAKGFSRIHRSYGVNLNQIDSIDNLPSGDGEISLRSGQRLNMSRRYKDAFRQKLG